MTEFHVYTPHEYYLFRTCEPAIALLWSVMGFVVREAVLVRVPNGRTS